MSTATPQGKADSSTEDASSSIHPSSRAALEEGVRQAFEGKPLLYAERQAFKNGDLASALESLLNRYRLARNGLLAIFVIQVLMVATELFGGGANAGAFISWPKVLMMLFMAGGAVQAHRSYRRTISKLSELREEL